MIYKNDVLNKLKMLLLDLETDQDKGDYGELCENKGARETIECVIAEISNMPTIEIDRRVMSQCLTQDYCKGWNDCVDSILRKDSK